MVIDWNRDTCEPVETILTISRFCGRPISRESIQEMVLKQDRRNRAPNSPLAIEFACTGAKARALVCRVLGTDWGTSFRDCMIDGIDRHCRKLKDLRIPDTMREDLDTDYARAIEIACSIL